MQSQIRVLHVFGTMTRHGAQLRTLDVCKSADSGTFHFAFCALSGEAGELDERLRELDFDVHHLKIFTPAFAWRFFRLLRNERYDVVHSHVHHSSGFILLLARLAGAPQRIAHFRNTVTDKDRGNRTSDALVRQLKMWLIDITATDILAVSHCAMKSSWPKSQQGDSRCRVVYNGLQPMPLPTPEQRRDVRSAIGLPESSPVLAHVGRFDRQKNHMHVLAVFREFLHLEPDARLLLIGKGGTPEARDVDAYIATHKMEKAVYRLGLRNDVLDLLGCADAMLFPSLWEGLPGSVLESLSVGTPVIGSDIAPIVEISTLTAGVYPLSLDAPLSDWISTLAEVLRTRGTQVQRREIIRRFSEAPFSLSTAATELQTVWLKTARHPVAGEQPGNAT